MTQYQFTGDVWRWPGLAAWHFVSVDKDVAVQIREDRAGIPRVGWGAVPVTVVVGTTTWKTSIFPHKKSETFLLPIKAEVRRRENISDGDIISIVFTT